MVFSWSDYQTFSDRQPNLTRSQPLGFRSSLGTRSSKLLLPLIIVAPKALKSPYISEDILVEIIFPTSSLPDYGHVTTLRTVRTKVM